MASLTPDVLTADIEAVVLDLDGTIYNKRHLPAHLIARNILWLSVLSAEQKTRKAMRGMYLGSKEVFYTEFFRRMADGRSFTPAVARWWYFHKYMPSMVSTLKQYYRPQPWFGGFLMECRKRHLRVVVYSDYGFVEEKLLALGLHADMFDFVLSAPSLGGLKPAKECAEEIAKRLNIPPAHCLFVGDRDDTDGASARAIGAKFCRVE